MTRNVAQDEISLTNFLSLLKKDKADLGIDTDIDYETVWKFVTSEEKELLKTKIISIEEKRVNSKKKILNFDVFKQKFLEYLDKQKHLSIAKFLKKTGTPISYTTLYRLIEDKEVELSDKKIVEVLRNGNKKTIKIISSDDMETFIKYNKVGA